MAWEPLGALYVTARLVCSSRHLAASKCSVNGQAGKPAHCKRFLEHLAQCFLQAHPLPPLGMGCIAQLL